MKQGSGLAYRFEFQRDWAGIAPLVDCVEILPESFFYLSDHSLDSHKEMFSGMTVLAHTFLCNIGSSLWPDGEALKKLIRVLDFFEIERVSDHLSFSRGKNYAVANFLPVVRNSHHLEAVCEKKIALEKFFSRPLDLENVVTFFSWPDSRMSDLEALDAVSHAGQGRILFDVNNIFVDRMNHESCIELSLSEKKTIRNCAVGFHIAGHEVADMLYLDSHMADVADPVWQLFSELNSGSNAQYSLLERDNCSADFEILESELKKLRSAIMRCDTVTIER